MLLYLNVCFNSSFVIRHSSDQRQLFLSAWIEHHPDDAQYISGATVSEVKPEADGYLVILTKDNSLHDLDGNVSGEGMDIAILNVFLDQDFNVVRVERQQLLS
jgi:hypothetical protein